ncbi:Protein-tyrosine kinase 2-beta [Galemys pyrenaicus]|uniref:Protein-tyrosine kinase 2-beta n=1 Tax=Galemys pyrenaicus TaxID=202257 RepID=A0A8J5ZS30_GALPY|nr:Protein-tyrosine kinase 2-beta [Galemys pyrenaicus]
MSGVPEPLSRVRVSTLHQPEGALEPVVVPVDVEKEDVRILKVCFYSNSFNPGKNFKLVKCTVHTEVQVRAPARPGPLPSPAAPRLSPGAQGTPREWCWASCRGCSPFSPLGAAMMPPFEPQVLRWSRMQLI